MPFPGCYNNSERNGTSVVVQSKSYGQSLLLWEVCWIEDHGAAGVVEEESHHMSDYSR
jgi:hypothetical protein